MSLWLSQEHEKSCEGGTEVPKQELGNQLFMNLRLSQNNEKTGGAGVPDRLGRARLTRHDWCVRRTLQKTEELFVTTVHEGYGSPLTYGKILVAQVFNLDAPVENRRIQNFSGSTGILPVPGRAGNPSYRSYFQHCGKDEGTH